MRLLAILTLLVCSLLGNAQINLSDSLIAYLPLNGSGLDASGNGNSAALSASGVYPTYSREGIRNEALLFNGALENGSLDFGTPLLNNRSEFSMSFWFKPASITNGMSLVGQDNILETGFYTSPNRVVTFHPNSGSVSANISISAGQWHHVAITVNTTQLRIYINGSLTESRNGNFSLGNNSTSTRIGGNVVNTSNNSWFRGNIDEVRFYNRTLNQDEINFLSSSISLTYTVGALPNTTYCAGDAITIPYTVIGSNIDTANVFTAQLSDASGSFDRPIALGSTTGSSSGSISATIPNNVPPGTGYKLRIVGSLPQAIGTTSAQTFTIQNPADGTATLTRERVLWLKFDATTADSSGMGNDGIALGGTSYVTDRFGNATSAIQLNGTNGYVDLPDGVWCTGPFAVSTWVNPTAIGFFARVCDFGNGQQNDNFVFALSNATTGNLLSDIRLGTSSTSNPVTTSARPALNTWSHVVFQHNGVTGQIYFNGVLAGEANIPLPRFVNRVNNYIGRSNWASDAYANCAFDDFMFFQRALTENEIDALASDGIIHANFTPCEGNFLQLSAPAIAGASYVWSGPNGFASTQRQNTLANVTAANSGTYAVTITVGGCAPFSQARNISIPAASGQSAVSFTGLPSTIDIQSAPVTLTGTPTGGQFTGNGIEANRFNPAAAGLGTHIILYNFRHSSGCYITAADTITVLPAYLMDNDTVTACSGAFYDSGGNGSNYSNNETFTKTFCSDNGERLQFNFTWMSLGTGDTLWAYDGADTNGALLAYYTPFSDRDVLWSSGTCITFRFKSNNTATTSGWAASFTCSANPVIPNEEILLSFGLEATCNAVVKDPAGNSNYGYGYSEQVLRSADSTRLRLDFTVFNINFNNGGHWLRIYDGPSTAYPLIGQYNSCCAPPTIIESSGQYLTLVFDARNTNAGVGSRQGFEANVSCFGSILPEYTMTDTLVRTCAGVFYDDGGPGSDFSPNSSYTETICSDNGQALRIDFNNNVSGFDSGDTLWVYAGNSINAPLLAMYVQQSRLETLQSTDTCLTFRFKSNSSTEPGWQGFISCTTDPAPANEYRISSGIRAICSGTVTDPAGLGNYGLGFNEQTLKSFDGSRLRLDFFQFNINFNNGGHWLRIYDGPSTAYPLIGQYNSCCAPPTIIESSGEYLTLVFDATNTNAGVGSRQGFAATVTCFGSVLPVFTMQDTLIYACEGVFYDDQGPANEYSQNFDGTQTFCSANGQPIQFTFNNNETRFDSGDTLWVFDGDSVNAPPLATYIQGSRMETLTSGGTCLTFKFVSNTSTEPGWQGFLSCVGSPPASVTYIMSSGTRNVCTGRLLDPGGTGNYPVGSGQTYIQTFTSYSGQQIRATRNSFSVNGNNGGHWLDVFDGPTTSSPLIGSYNNFNFPPAAFQSTGSSLTFRFRATNTATGTGSGFDFSLSCFSGSPIDADWVASPVCQGGDLQVPFILNDSVGPGNIYTVQISDSTGSFSNATTIGSLTTTDSTGTIQATIPASLPATSGYRVRVNSSNPVQLGAPNPNNIIILPTPVAPNNISISGPSIFCNGTGSATLSVATQIGVNYRWILDDTVTVGSNTNSYIATQSGTYTVELYNGCDTVMVTNPRIITTDSTITAPTITAGGPTTFCSGQSVTLSIPAQTGVTYQWKNGTTNVGTNSNSFTATAAGTYSVELSNACGNVGSVNTITVTISGTAPVTPTIIAGGPTSFCAGGSVVLSASTQSGVNYQWKNGTTNVGTNSNSFTATAAGNYTLEVSNSCGTVTSNSITVTISGTAPTAPTITAGGPTTFCSGQSVTLSIPAQTGVTYQWKNGTTNVGTNSNTFTATVAGTYSVELSNACGNVGSVNSVTVTISGTAPVTPSIIAGGPTSFCAGGSVVLSASTQSGVNYQWKNGTTNVGTNSNSFTATAAGNYTLEVSNSCGTVTSNSITVSISGTAPTAPTITAGGPTTFCSGQSVTLSIPAQTGVTYQWKNGTTNVGTNSNTFTATAAGTYSVELSNACGNVGSVNSVTVTISGTAPVTPSIIAGGPTSFCAGGSVVLSASTQSGVNYQWKNGTTNVGTNSNSFTATAAGNYTLEVSNSCGTVTSNSITVNISGTAPTAPTITAGGPTTFCSGQSVSLSIPAQTGVTYQWKNGTTNVGTNSNTFTATAAGTYSVELSNACGNVGSVNTITVTISGTAPVTPSIIAGGPTSFCAGGSVVLSASTQSGVSYQWKNGTTNVGTNNNSFTATAAGNYTLEVSNSCGTVTSNIITVSISGTAPTAPTITAGGPTTFCSGQSVSLSIPVQTGVTYQWKNGTTNVGTNSNSFTATAAGTYSVELSNACGNVGSVNTITVTVTPGPPVPAITSNSPLCEGETLELLADSIPGAQYSWTGPDGLVGNQQHVSIENVTVFDAGLYTLSATVAGCPAVSAGVTVVIEPAPLKPIISAIGNVLTASGLDLQWYLNGQIISGVTGNTYTAAQDGWYYVTDTDSFNNCVATSDSVFVQVAVGIDENFVQNWLTVYPNPATDRLFVEILNSVEEELPSAEILNMQGQTIQSGIMLETKLNLINISTLSAGMYYLKITKGQWTEHKAFVVAKQ